MPAARMKSSVGDFLFFLFEGDFYENFGAERDTLSAPLNMPLSNDLLRYSWESEDTERSQLIQLGSSSNCASCNVRKRTQEWIAQLIVNIAVISIHIAVFSGLDNILK